MAELIGEELRRFITKRANGRCEYCQSQEAFATERFLIEHIQPRAAGGETVTDNLALACQGCNGHKATKTNAVDSDTETIVPLFNPRQHFWQEHFNWGKDNLHITGLTAIGRATIVSLRLNRPSLVNLRRALLAINEHPPFVG